MAPTAGGCCGFVWPDRSGRLPWDQDYDPRLRVPSRSSAPDVRVRERPPSRRSPADTGNVDRWASRLANFRTVRRQPMGTGERRALDYPAVIGIVAGWQLTVPCRYKNSARSPRDVAAGRHRRSATAGHPRRGYRQARCPHCHHVYRAADVVPVLSWFHAVALLR